MFALFRRLTLLPKAVLLILIFMNIIVPVWIMGCQTQSTQEKHLSDSTMLSPSQRSSGGLVNLFEWEWVQDQLDPFEPLIQRDDILESTCDGETHGIEEVSPGVWSYFVETDRCHWLTLRQKIRFPLYVGDQIQLKVWHFDLNAPQRAVAHLGLATEDETLIWVQEPIPQAGRMVKEEGVVTQDLSQGEWLYFHLDNHGANSWHLLEIKLVLSDPPN